ncbi:Zinc-type alcohol dehydrogenase-like protein, partial [Pseudolycoriella hygida]
NFLLISNIPQKNSQHEIMPTNCVFNTVEVPPTPLNGARIKVVYAGACYQRQRTPSLSSQTSVSSEISDYTPQPTSPAHQGIRDAALFPGFEVAGIIDELGANDLPAGYAEYIVVPELKYLIVVPDQLKLSVAAMLPTGALLAMNTILEASEAVTKIFEQNSPDYVCKILIVGTGGLALWAVRLAAHSFSIHDSNSRVKITMACLRDEGFKLANELKDIKVVQWSEDLYETQLIERTKDACDGEVDIVIDFGSTSRSLNRSLQCLQEGGVVFISKELAEHYIPKFWKKAGDKKQKIQAVANGSIDQLQDLVQLVATDQIEPPPHHVYPLDQASEVVRKLCGSEINGRAILKFHDIE